MGILDVRASVAADQRYIKTTDVVDASSDFAPASALSRISTLEGALNIQSRPTTPATTLQPVAWLRADQISGVVNGASVQSWASATGAGTAIPNTLNGGTAPTLLTNAVAGRPAVAFRKAAVSKLKFGTANYAKAMDHTIFVVARHPVLANSVHIIHGINDTADASATLGIRASVSTAGVFSTSVFGSATSTPSTSSTSIVANTWNLFRIDYSTTSVPMATLNGTSATPGAAATDTVGTLTSLALGGYGTGTSDIDIAEVIYFGNQLATADAKTWEQYLAAVYQITVAA